MAAKNLHTWLDFIRDMARGICFVNASMDRVTNIANRVHNVAAFELFKGLPVAGYASL